VKVIIRLVFPQQKSISLGQSPVAERDDR